MDFVEWMKSTGLSKKSVGSYAGAINGCLSEWAREQRLTSKEIGEITNLTEFNSLAEEIRQIPIYQARNVIGHGMYSAALNVYRRYLQEAGIDRDVTRDEYGPYQKEVDELASETSETFDPKDHDDARQRVLREVVRRRGQAKFRKSLISAYDGRCAITDCPVISLLEAAHITPYLGPDTNAITNGLLLRADLHTLWDLGLIAVDPTMHTVWVSPQVNDPTYQALYGTSLRRPNHDSQRPSVPALQQQWDLAYSQSSDTD